MTASKQQHIDEMFDRIASTYDAINRVLSFRQDLKWRRALCDRVPKDQALSVLDLATGTSDLLIEICRHRFIKEAIGVDNAANMLAYAEKKIKKERMPIKLIQADAASLPFVDEQFDVVSIAFGIRNIAKPHEALREIKRVLKKDGMLLILEFSIPENAIIRAGYLFYFRAILPIIGGLLSKDYRAYRYLNLSVEAFKKPDVFTEDLKLAGFSDISFTSLTLGVVTLYSARKDGDR